MNNKQMKVVIIILFISIFILSLLVLYPKLEFQKDNKLYYFSYNKVVEEFEENMCYDESYSYNKKRDISLHSWELKEYGIFKIHIMEYKEGNVCETEYVLEPSYIDRIINEATIESNESNIDLASLINNKKPIVSNTRYTLNDNYDYIGYKLDGEYKEMFISYNEEGLLIIQIGNSDEGPKYIAYK